MKAGPGRKCCSLRVDGVRNSADLNEKEYCCPSGPGIALDKYSIAYDGKAVKAGSLFLFLFFIYMIKR